MKRFKAGQAGQVPVNDRTVKGDLVFATPASPAKSLGPATAKDRHIVAIAADTVSSVPRLVR